MLKIVSEVPLDLARVASSTSELRMGNRTARSICNIDNRQILVALGVSTIFVGIKGGFSVEKFLLVVVAPLTPAFGLGRLQYKGYTESADAGR